MKLKNTFASLLLSATLAQTAIADSPLAHSGRGITELSQGAGHSAVLSAQTATSVALSPVFASSAVVLFVDSLGYGVEHDFEHDFKVSDKVMMKTQTPDAAMTQKGDE